MKQWDVIIIGGGASGIVSAIYASRLGHNVCLIERNNRIGKKILMTGNGTCNLTNQYDIPEHFHTSASDSKFIQSVLERYNHRDTISFFEQLGIEIVEEERGKLYPLVKQAAAILDVLLIELKRLNVTLITDTQIVKVTPKNNGFDCIDQNNNRFSSHSVIMATGGKAAPDTGSDGNGFQLLSALNHHVTPVFPTLIQLNGKNAYMKELKGTKIVGCISLWKSGVSVVSDTDEILFTDYGLSGPAVINVSRVASQAICLSQPIEAHIDFIPKYTHQELIELIEKRIHEHATKSNSELLIGLIHKRLIQPCLKTCGLDLHQPCSELTRLQINQLSKCLKAYVYEITGTHQWNQAQSTAGGIALDEINPMTMESLLHKQLFVTGEILDVDGDCGGFNLQWAWSTAFIAAHHIKK